MIVEALDPQSFRMRRSDVGVSFWVRNSKGLIFKITDLGPNSMGLEIKPVIGEHTLERILIATPHSKADAGSGRVRTDRLVVDSVIREGK